MTTAFIEPLDVLVLRGNHLFGEPGSFGAALMPPWPSVFAGALRSHLLVHEGIDPARFGAGHLDHPSLGTPQRPGPFTLTGVHLAQRHSDGRLERLFPIPADGVVQLRDDGAPVLFRLMPQESALSGSYPLPKVPVLKAPQGKPASGWLLREAGWAAWLAGEEVSSEQLLRASEVWAYDQRPGVGLAPERRAAADGALFTTETIAMRSEPGRQYGFVVRVAGLSSSLPEGILRLGGDGRGAMVQPTDDLDRLEPDYDKLIHDRRMRIVLTSPGIFPQGWKPPGTDAEGRFRMHGVSGRLVSAAVSRGETVSGWDLARSAPKPAQHVAPAGSVYWIEDLEAEPPALDKLVESGLWLESGENAGRRAEGFNRCMLGVWS